MHGIKSSGEYSIGKGAAYHTCAEAWRVGILRNAQSACQSGLMLLKHCPCSRAAIARGHRFGRFASATTALLHLRLAESNAQRHVRLITKSSRDVNNGAAREQDDLMVAVELLVNSTHLLEGLEEEHTMPSGAPP